MKYVRGLHEDQHFQQLATERLQEENKRNESIRNSIKQLQENKKKYEHQIDYIVRDLIEKEKLDV